MISSVSRLLPRVVPRRVATLCTIVQSPYPAPDIPEVPFTEYVLQVAEKFGDKPALIDGLTGATVRYNELGPRISSAATNLAELGFGPGDVLAIHLPNTIEYALAFHAACVNGGTNTTVNPTYTAYECEHQLRHSGAKFMLTHPLFLDVAKEAAEKAGVEKLFVLGDDDFFGDNPRAPDVPKTVDIDVKDQLAVLPYSSGTTGLPKGVMLTHHNLVSNLEQIEAWQGSTRMLESDMCLGVLPFFHIYGMIVVMASPLTLGATVVILPNFEPGSFLKTLQDYKITYANVVPPLVLFLAKHPAVEGVDLSTLRLMFSGAAPLDAELTKAAQRRLPHAVATQGYGMTELSPVSHLSDGALPGSVGDVIPGCECKIVPLGETAGAEANVIGELWTRGPNVMKGYLNNPEATAETIDEDGWLHTGDMGYHDGEGHFWVIDRVKELIKVKGFQVAPAEVEAALLEFDDIADAAVIPIPDERSGELPKAFVVKGKEDLTEQDVVDHLTGMLSDYKIPAEVEFVDAIPKSASGKILRRLLRDQEAEKHKH